MCLIACCIDNKLDFETVQKIHAKNSDLIGIGWFDGDIPRYTKGLYPATAFEIMEKLPLPFVVHFRYASAGMSRFNYLSHPFEVTDKSELKADNTCPQLLFHNGTLSGYRILLATADIPELDYNSTSDTRALAMILAKLQDINKQQRLLKTLQGRFVLMDAASHKFKLFGSFIDDYQYPGIKFSNLEWKYSYASNYSYTSCGSHSLTVKDKRSEVMTQEEKLAYDRHLEFEKTNKITKSDEKFHCKRCARELPLPRVAYLQDLGFVGSEMFCLGCKSLNGSAIIKDFKDLNPPPQVPETNEKTNESYAA